MSVNFSFDQNDIWSFFKKLNQIPRVSTNTEPVAKFLVDEFSKLGYAVRTDEYNNVFFNVPASQGKENHPSVLLQAHSDMVGVKANGSSHNFATDPIEMYEKDGWVHAKETTLGADNGIGIAYIYALLNDKSISHPRLQVLFTSDEEISTVGMIKFDKSWIDSKYMINLDSEESDLVSYGCAGCSILEYLYSLETTEVNNSYKTYEITISNLLGGHSGAYIHELRGNANIMLSDLISEIANKVNIQLISFNSVDPILNVISQTSTCKIAFNENQFNEVQNIINSRKNYLLEHYQAEKNAKFTINSSSHESNALALTDSSLNKFLTLNTILPNGSVETFNIKYNVYNVSSNFYNIALNNGDVRNSMSIRFIRSSHLDYLLNKINTIYSHILGKGNYKIIDTGFKMDPWEYKEDNELGALYNDVYKTVYNTLPKNVICAGGLETSFIAAIKKDMHILSFGPDIVAAHSADEKVNIESTEKIYEIFVKLIEKL